MREKWEMLSYRNKILLQLTIMSILPILIFTFYSYYIIREDMIKTLDLISSKRAEKVQERIDNILTSIWGSYFDIFETEAVDKVMTQTLSYHDYSIYAEAIDQLQGHSYLKDYIRCFSFINLETDWVLSSRGMYPFSEAENREELLALLEISDGTGKLLYSTKEFAENLPYNTIDLSGGYILFKLPVLAETPQCVVVVNLKMKAFQEFVDEQDGYEITVLDNEGRLLLTTDSTVAEYLADNMETVEPQSWIRLADHRKIRVSAVLTEMDFKYIVTYDNDLTGKNGGRIISFSMFLLAVLLITGFGVIIMRRRVYQPIQNLTDRISDAVQFENIKGDDVLLFIEKNILGMTYTIRNQKNEMVKLLMSRLLTGSIQDEEIERYRKELELEAFPQYCVLVLSPPAYSKWNEDMEGNALLRAIDETVITELKPKEIWASRVWQKALVALIGLSTKTEIEEKIGRIKSFIQSYLKENGIEEMQFGASQVFDSLEQTLRGYNEAMEAMKVSEIEYMQSGIYKLILYADIAQSMEYPLLPSVSSEVKIRELVDECREKEACMEAERFVDELYQSRIPVPERRYYLYRLLFAVLEVPHDAGLLVSGIKSLDGNDLFLSFSRLCGSENLKKFISKQVIPDVICQLREFRSIHSMDIQERIIKMIRKSKGDTTLAECAERLNYSPRHLERILRCENNEAFSNYVAEQKLIYAKSLLEGTESSVADIARELNYANTQNFIRFFSKRTGISPGRYRQDYKSKAGMPDE